MCRQVPTYLSWLQWKQTIATYIALILMGKNKLISDDHNRFIRKIKNPDNPIFDMFTLNVGNKWFQ